jgi:hypothetical protein
MTSVWKNVSLSFLFIHADGLYVFARSLCSHSAAIPLPFGNFSIDVNSMLSHWYSCAPSFCFGICFRCVPCQELNILVNHLLQKYNIYVIMLHGILQHLLFCFGVCSVDIQRCFSVRPGLHQRYKRGGWNACLSDRLHQRFSCSVISVI